MSRQFTEDYGGAADGVALTTGNSAYSSFTNAPKFSTAKGKPSMILNSNGVATNDAALQAVGSTVGQRWMRRYVLLDVVPGTFTTLFRVRASGTSQAQVRINSAAQFVLRDDISALSTLSALTYTADSWARVEWLPDDPGNLLTMRLFVGANVDGTTPDETVTRAYTGASYNEVLDTNAATSGGAVNAYFAHAADDDAAFPGPFATAPETGSWTYSTRQQYGA